MSDTRMKTRIVHKHATEANWSKAINFTPLQAEVIVYDIDDNYPYERIKIGDGIHNVNDLPFSHDNLTADDFGIYVQAQEPTDAVAGDIWIDTMNDPTYIPPTLPEITEADNGKVLMVVNGQLQLVNLNMSIDTNGVVHV